MKNVNLSVIVRLVLHKQHLTDDSKIDNVTKTVNDICGLHATGSTVPYLSLFARTRNFQKENLYEELYIKRSLGKIRCMRGTLYILTKEMLPIVYAATRRFVEKSSKQYVEFRGISSKEYERISQSIMNLLKSREMTASEIKKTLKTQLDVSAILYHMCDQGLLIRSRPEKGWKDRNHRYSLFREYFPDIDLAKIDEANAITLLVQKYLSSFGPATEKDIVWWTGLSKTKVQEALNNTRKRIVQIEIQNVKNDFIMLDSDERLMRNIVSPKKRTVNLLPSLDPYLMGYRERERYICREHYDKVFDRSGNATSTILLDGRVVGVWDFSEEPEPTVKILLFEEVEQSVLTEIYLEAQKIGRFTADKEVKIKECDHMIPLTCRTAGGVMSPLKGC